MYICLCYAITDKQIKHAVREQGVGSMRELRQTLNIGGQCGKCIRAAQQIIDNTIIDESLFKEVV
ncbi:bacterioferritin-associated ferredoxin [Bowmanella sp. JS7-9]|uniref:Bacterioferritin-associated ferredoxin n=1 Tax=Pseudobowmanella zhangzhouensis TaxID=1537679 RepID=A0ABW1XLC7_9ALTE|nr:bacterioferritin-associated ferredoxin [Bowmanella sp. JS7-9]TBX20616.1 bacterioferritin [Bowmanella sp. JS7-9]